MNGKLLSSLIYIPPIIVGTTQVLISNTNYAYASFTTIGSANSINFLQKTICDVLIIGGGV